jgi:hypothetical protein
MKVMEDNVLNYGSGYVVRVQCTDSEFYGMVRRVVSGCRPADADWFPVSSNTVRTVSAALTEGLFGGGVRTVHIVGSKPYSVYQVANMASEEEVVPSETVRNPLLLSDVLVGLYSVNLFSMNSSDLSAGIRSL